MVDLINVNPWDLWIVNAQAILIFTYDLENQVYGFFIVLDDQGLCSYISWQYEVQCGRIQPELERGEASIGFPYKVFIGKKEVSIGFPYTSWTTNVGKHPLGFPIKFSLEKSKYN